MKGLELKIESIADIPSAAKEIFDFLQLNNRRQIAFYGEMGAGKTTLINAILNHFKIDDHVSSPTFSIINEYFSEEYGKVYHCDFYRINNPKEALEIGVEELFEEDSWCFVEWPEKLGNLLPQNFVSLKIREENACRLIEIKL